MLCCNGSNENGDEEAANKTNRPSDSRFKQQKLPAWQPILTASTVLPLFFVIAIVFIPIGIALLVASNNIQEKVIVYTDASVAKDCEKCFNIDVNSRMNPRCQCEVEFTLDEDFEGDVYLYYGLVDFYQNHRRYVRSRDDSQLNGDLSQSVNSNCEPFDKNDTTGKAFAPCGAIANSMFNDKLTLQYNNSNVPVSAKEISWKSDRDTKFKNPSDLSEFSNFERPKYWFTNITELGSTTGNGVGFQNEDFIVWMRVAAFPSFRKLYRRVIHEGDFAKGLPAGNYKLLIDYNFPVESFSGKKEFILTTTSWIGAKNSFLGVIYIVVGCICLVFAFIFLVIHLKVRTRPLTS